MQSVPLSPATRIVAGILVPMCLAAGASAQPADDDLVVTLEDCGELCVWQARLGQGVPRESHTPPPGAVGGISVLAVPSVDGPTLVIAERFSAEAGRSLWTVQLDAEGGLIAQQTLGGMACAAAPRGAGAVLGIEQDDAYHVALIDAAGAEVARAPFDGLVVAVAAGTDGRFYGAGNTGTGPLLTAYSADGSIDWTWTGDGVSFAAETEAIAVASLANGRVRAVLRSEDPAAEEFQTMRRWLVDLDASGAVTTVVDLGLDVTLARRLRWCGVGQGLTNIIPTADGGTVVAVLGEAMGGHPGLSLSRLDADGTVVWQSLYPSTFARTAEEVAAALDAEETEEREEEARRRVDSVTMDADERIWISGYKLGPGIDGFYFITLLDEQGEESWRHHWMMFDGDQKIDQVLIHTLAATPDGDVISISTAGMPKILERAVVTRIDVPDTAYAE